MILYDAQRNEIILEKVLPFHSDKTIGYFENKIDGKIHRFYFVIEEKANLYVEIDDVWYMLPMTPINDFYTKI